MEYENCLENDNHYSTIFGLSREWIGALIILLVVVLIVYVASIKREKFTDRADEIKMALENTLKTEGNIVDFKRAIQDPKFSPTKYIYLTDLYRRGLLTKDSVNKALDDAGI
jgi:hypothetical protein